eukprot:17364-Amorphochlora_amoeboformis.AAC.2
MDPRNPQGSPQASGIPLEHIRSIAMSAQATAEAKKHSQKHQKWIVETLKEHKGKCTYEVLVEVGEKHHCDTVGAMLKILKKRKVIYFKQMFLMYPMHKNEVVELKKPDYDPMKE